jgi:hypothetical protein
VGVCPPCYTRPPWSYCAADLRDPDVQVRTLRLIAGLDDETLATYTRIVLIAAPDESSRRALEALMATVFKNEFVDKLQAEGRAQMILQVLAARRIAVPAEVREQVLAHRTAGRLGQQGRHCSEHRGSLRRGQRHGLARQATVRA